MRLMGIEAFISLGLVLLMAGCQKDKTELYKLPPITSSGQNTFGCLINGQAFVAHDQNPFFAKTIQASIGYHDTIGKIYDIQGSFRTESLYSHIFLSLADASVMLHVGNSLYILVDERPPGTFKSVYYETDSLKQGKLTFSRIDDHLGIYSGTFEGDVVNNKGEVLHITAGRFDTKPFKDRYSN